LVVVLAIVVLLLAGLGSLWFGMPPNVPGKPVQLVRGVDGRLVPVGDSPNAAQVEGQERFLLTTEVTPCPD